MKLATFIRDGRETWGVVDGETVRHAGAVLADRYPTLRDMIAANAYAEAAAAAADSELTPLDKIEWAPVITDPRKILCVGHNYESHRKETGRAKVEHPSLFTRFADTLIGHEKPIPRPRESDMLDFEGELAVIIGRPGRRIAPADALAHVAGYTCFNDASIRNFQWHTTQFTPGKNFPGTGACGPWLVTPDEIGDPSSLAVTTRLNGEIVQNQPTSDMIFDIPTIIAYVSTFTPLSAGDIIATGTPGGVGAKREPPLWMKPGDVVEIDIPGIGVLRNPVRNEI
jgi:2-keto-4-pentenoate hydratase/2-oxohepta-3-ene-1,7-dioic acid hydratase in catechol pathway